MALGIPKLRHPHQIPWLFTRYRPTCSPARTALLQPQACHFQTTSISTISAPAEHSAPKRKKAADALRHHVRADHSPSPPPGAAKCPHCRQSCRNVGALVLHVLHEHGSTTTSPCPHCTRIFDTGDALARHVSASHQAMPAIRYACPYCPNHSYKSFNGLGKHVRVDHPGRVPPPRLAKFPCGHCQAVFKTGIQLARHVTAEHPPEPSPLAPGEATPLDAYFHAHRDRNDFSYDRRAVPSHSFNRLLKYLRWEGDELLRERRAFGAALRAELVLWFGGEEVHALQRFSRAVGAGNRVPYSVNAFRRNFRNKQVNLIDLLHWARHERDASSSGKKDGGGVELEPVRVFESRDELLGYSTQNAKGFPLEFTGRDYSTDEGNLVLWHLLRGFPKEMEDKGGDPSENDKNTNNVSQGEASHGSEKKEHRQGYTYRSISHSKHRRSSS